MDHGRAISGITITNPKDGTLSSTGKTEVEKWATGLCGENATRNIVRE